MSATRRSRIGRRPSAVAGASAGLAALLVLLACVTTGGFDSSITVSGANTWAEIVLLAGGAIAAAALLVLEVPGLGRGGPAALLFGVLTAVTALSILWSVQPDNSWQAANLTLAYLAAFVAAIAAARIAPGHWRALLAAIGLAMVALSAYGLLSKVFPASLAAGESQGRLQVPLGYWNASGAAAAMGLPACLWVWQRREGAAWSRSLAAPGAAVLLTVIVLSYSRTSLIVVAVLAAGWLVLVPGRLRAIALMAIAGAGAAVLSAWGLARPGLTGDDQALALRTSAGHTYGVICALVLLALAVAGWALAAGATRRPPSPRLRRGLERALLAGLALLPVLAILGLAFSSRGLTGEISHAWSSLTSTSSGVGNGATRVTQLGSSRPLYWSEGITVGEHALLKGVGALGYATARTRYTTHPEVTGHAHSYIVQTFADLGLVGLAVNLALLLVWARAAAATIATGALRRARGRRMPAARDAERTGQVALLLVVIGFGLSSAADWTWFFPGVTVPALLAAGWLAGRGAPDELATRPERWRALSRRPGTGAMVTAVAALALIAGWLVWQPLRSNQAINAAEAAAIRGDSATAFAQARSARAADPLALGPLLLLAAFDHDTGNLAAARRELVTAVDLQPENANSWLALGTFDLTERHARRALPALTRAYALDPTVPITGTTLAQARRALATGALARHPRRHHGRVTP